MTTLNYPRIIRKFLSTPSMRRATVSVSRLVHSIIISIHALHEEGDGLRLPPCALHHYFYPRPP